MPSRKLSIPNNLFAGPYLERRAEEREHADWLARALADPHTSFIALQGSTALVTAGPGDGSAAQAALVMLPGEHSLIRTALERSPERTTLLGWFRGRRCVLVDIESAADAAMPPQARFDELRPLASAFEPDEAALFAYARALAHWRATHRFCGRCGAPLRAARAGHALVCSACAQQSFPRMDPAIIVLVSERSQLEERALLGRQASWPANRYSTIAGFVEPGEALEDAVRREVLEETGVTLQQVDYHASQPWPFPASLMLGFVATAESGQQPVTNDGELEDARWFTRDDVHSGRVLLPPRESISRQLINHWLDAGACA